MARKSGGKVGRKDRAERSGRKLGPEARVGISAELAAKTTSGRRGCRPPSSSCTGSHRRPVSTSAPGRTRTCGLWFRRPTLCPAELQAHAGGEGGIRTLDRSIHSYTRLAGERLQPLGHFSQQRRGSPPQRAPILPDGEFLLYGACGNPGGRATRPCGGGSRSGGVWRRLTWVQRKTTE